MKFDTGIEFINDIADFDALHNFSEKNYKFTTAPADAKTLYPTGLPQVPIQVLRINQGSIDTYERRELVVQDAAIQSLTLAPLRATAELENIDEIYSFRGKQAIASLQEMVQQHPELDSAKRSVGTPAMVAKWTQQMGKNAAVVAQDPLGAIYAELLPGPTDLQVLASAEIEYLMCGSEGFLRRCGVEGLTMIADSIREIAL